MADTAIAQIFIYSLDADRKTKKNKRFWSPYEDKVLSELIPIFSYKEIAIIFKRTEDAIVARIIKKIIAPIFDSAEIIKNNISEFADNICNKTYFTNIPKDDIIRYIKYALKSA